MLLLKQNSESHLASVKWIRPVILRQNTNVNATEISHVVEINIEILPSLLHV